jgi:P4 family phage/plasmid primase-like protien
MVDAFRGYVRTQNKQPCQKFGNGETLLTLEEAGQYDEYAGILNGEFTVKDIDEMDEGERILRIVKDLDLNCRVYKTKRGIQFMFRSSEFTTKGVVKAIDALGFTFDVRIGVNMYIVLKNDGKVREILRDFDESREIDKFPKWLSPIRGGVKFTGLGDGSGRNATLFRYIGTLVRNGFTKDEIKFVMPLINDYAFAEPLSDAEIQKVTRDEAIEKFLAFSAERDFAGSLRPTAFTDIAMAEGFARECGAEVRYTSASGWLVWQENKWEISDLKAQQRYIDFAKKVLEDAKSEVKSAYAEAALAETGGDEDTQDRATKTLKAAEGYHKFALKMCEHGKVSGVLKLARSALETGINELDADAFALNTPSGIVNLRTGAMDKHSPDAMCTKITHCSPSLDGMELWNDCLRMVTLGDADYQRFLQCLAGATAIGKVYHEALVIAHGSGANGKSTVFNTIAAVLGDYAGKIPAESLTTRAKNVKVDLAELLGKRFVLASETEEGQRLSVSMLKQIASVDSITAERKYHDPFTFIPTHSTILYTNHLPKVGSGDRGTWRRLVVAPFYAEIKNPKTDYAEQLLEQACGAVAQWIIDGAKMFIDSGYKLPKCAAVDDAVERYKEENDWLGAFLAECCTVGKGEKCAGGVLYKTFREWATETGEYARRNRDFAEALRLAGFNVRKTMNGNMWEGLSLSADRSVARSVEDDFLT